MSEPNAALAPLARAARWTLFRVQLDEALQVFATGLVPTLTATAAFVTHAKLTYGAHGAARNLLASAIAVSGVVTVAFVVRAFTRPRAVHEGAIRLDKAHGLHDRITNALTFAALPEAARTPLMDAAIADGVDHSSGLAPAKAAPLHFPKDLAAALGLGVLLVGLGALQWQKTVYTPLAPTIDAVGLTPDDLDLFRSTLDELAKKDQSPEAQAALQQFNQLVEDISQKRIDRAEAYKRMDDIESALAKDKDAQAKALDEALKDTADSLKKSNLSKPAAEALEKHDLPGAEKAIKELAQKLKDKQSKITEADKKRLKEALAEASKKLKESLAKMQAQREALSASLLQREQKAGAQTDEEKHLLQRDKRELDRLDRDIKDKEQAQRQLDKLDRDLAQAAEDLMKDLGLSQEDLQKGAEDINRMAQDEMTEHEKEELRQRIQELRELLRQEGQGGEELKKRLRKFAKKAHGKQGDKGDKGEKGDKGDKGEKADKKPGEGDEDDDDDGDDEGDEDGDKQGKKPGQEGDGDGQGEKQGHGGKKKGIKLTMGQGQGQGQQGQGQGQQGEGQGEGQQGQGQQGSGNSGEGQQGQGQQGSGSPGGPGAEPGNGKQGGSGHDPNVAGSKGTSGKFGTQDVQAAATDTGQGPNVSETIHGAAGKGFRGGDYKKVYTDYRTKAEEAMKQEDIPPGYKFYVQRYFQLIRPRD